MYRFSRRAGILLVTLGTAASLISATQAVAGAQAAAGAQAVAGTTGTANRTAARPSTRLAHPAPVKAEIAGAHAAASSAAQHAVRQSRVDAALAPAMSSTKSVEVDIHGDMTQASAAVRAAGGQIRAQVAGAMTASVPGFALAGIGDKPGITGVRQPLRPIEYTVTSQGVALSNASAWQSANVTGTGVKVAIIDAGYENLPQAVAAVSVQTDLCAAPQADEHGAAVADIVHDMAPGAELYLYCVDTQIEVVQAEQSIASQGIHIITTSLGWTGDSRGDGTGDASTVAYAVRDARQRGILWINAAGNEAQDHWSGTLVDSDADHFVDIGSAATEFDSAEVAPGGTASMVLTWDQWPVSNLPLELFLFPWQCESTISCENPTPVNGFDPYGNPIPDVLPQTPGTSPVLGADISDPGQTVRFWDAYVGEPSSNPGVRYDITWDGDVNVSDLAFQYPAQAAAGSLDPIASSPYAMAVGAVDASGSDACVDTATTVGGLPLEAFSSEGPTVDGRQKPDIAGYDGTNSNVYPTGFCGTSAAAPHVAGAAALALQADPNLDASQLESFLEQRANHGSPTNPASNLAGHGALNLGAVGAAAPVGSSYTALASPVRVLDTRTGQGRPGGVAGPIPPAQSISVSMPSAVPANATAVSVNVTGVYPAGQSGATYLGVFPGGVAWPGTSNVNLAPPNDTTAAASTIVALGPGGVLQVQDGGVTADAILDITGYFTAGSGNGYDALASPTRVYDARLGGGLLTPGSSVVVHPAAPSGATSVLVNITATLGRGTGWFNASPVASAATSVLNFQSGLDRANMAVVALDASGNFTVSDGGAAAFPIVDVEGYFAAGGAKFVALPSPVRIMDTRTGNGGQATPLNANGSFNLFVAGIDGVPYGAQAVVAGATVIDDAGSTWLTAYPYNSPLPNASNINATAGRVVPNGVTVAPGSRFVTLRNNAGSIDLLTDLFGYFD